MVGPGGSLAAGRTLPGRGAWLCREGGEGGPPSPACVELARRRRAFSRALRSDIADEATERLWTCEDR